MKVLVANRGEIAVRVIRACRELGIPTVAVYSDCDRGARHVRDADQAVHIGASQAAESYLNIAKLIDAAQQTGADAVHPGYGFLAENAAFARACAAAGLAFIGPGAEAIRLMGSKTGAREIAVRAGVPVVPGTDAPLAASAPDAEILDAGARVGYPLMVKAVAGGGGKGMRVVESADALLNAVRTARSEAGSAFGDTAVYFERRITNPRHVEIQLLADHHGTVIPFVERECSIQRRHQKVVEESPSTAVSAELRRRIAGAAAAVARAAGYTNAGTIEFLLDAGGSFYFLEMNTRLQVEHPVTEMVTSIDLVHWQIRIARGEPLTLDPERALTPHGHAIECRIYAEDPDQGFMPSPGLVRGIRPASGPGIRDDGGVLPGFTVPVFYDSMIAKLIAWAETRGEAIARMTRALEEYEVLGIRTTIPFFLWLMRQPDFQAARFDTMYLDRLLASRRGESFSTFDEQDERHITIAAALDAMFRSSAGVNGSGASGLPPRSAWTAVARREALRG
ncbi:MAG TPA: acetyl-CoA carboxylase biotin carboxylase subunit [Vicinamibacterales bacterium]|nr:acetyl-CoA carboxylase biotin carboxylase subunit [Vicinamibacterales bacterium]